jgi:hypothetical protein
MDASLADLFTSIAAGDRATFTERLGAAPEMATARLARTDERFLAAAAIQLYEGTPHCTQRRSATTRPVRERCSRAVPTSAPRTDAEQNRSTRR